LGGDFFWELATLIVVMLLGHWLEARSVLGASRALEELVRVMPTTAHVVMGTEVVDMPVSHLQVGSAVLVRPGEKIPSDGVVVDGESYVNEAYLQANPNQYIRGLTIGLLGAQLTATRFAPKG
jgi:Cu2+-exporting ATPase